MSCAGNHAQVHKPNTLRVWTNRSVNDSCRFCSSNIFYQGRFSHFKSIFDSKARDDICSQLSKLGLIVDNTPLRSFRICNKCVVVINRLLRDTEIVQKWKEKEMETETCHGGDASSTDKRDREPTPSKTPRALKKSRKSTEMPSRSSVTDVRKPNKMLFICSLSHAVLSFVVLPQINIHVLVINSNC